MLNEYEREILLVGDDNIPALWINNYNDGRRTINDCNTEVELEADADIENEVEQWKAAVECDRTPNEV